MSLRQDIIDNHDSLQRKALYITSGDADKAHDLVQDGVCRMLANESRYTPGSDINSWAFIIMRNLFYSREAKKQKIDKLTLGGEIFHFDGFLPCIDIDFLGIEHTIPTELMHSMIDRLKPDHKTVIKLKLDGYRTVDLPGVLGIPLGTVKSRLFYAIKSMREMFYGTQEGNNHEDL